MTRILIVEDNDMNWDMLSRRLERRGYQVTRALDGRDGVKTAQAQPPDLILMDMGLPVMDGWEATRVLKGAPATRGIPIIGLTAHAMAEDRQKVMDAGCDDYETKPLDLARLLVKIETLLNRGPKEH
jgi:CheY-like chemotaxis protein